ncbi:hypothetical protein Acr_20g0005780 [Actinidia rufa]|uniref:Uncharacterized protein n=1 Tax=Actinidia rufa TaxID=165716 RepID=A0A7J0GD90_9ERIC|nr:hypothetical protein Acr_20g0005780 [Actinidia rufa]
MADSRSDRVNHICAARIRVLLAIYPSYPSRSQVQNCAALQKLPLEWEMYHQQKAISGLERGHSSKRRGWFRPPEFQSLEQGAIIQNTLGYLGKERFSMGPMGPPGLYEVRLLLGAKECQAHMAKVGLACGYHPQAFLYPLASQIWANVKSWLGISRNMQSLKAAVKWIIKEARGTGFPAKIKRIGLARTVYYIWEARNIRIFEGKIDQPKAISRRIQIQSYRILYSLFPEHSP